MAINFSDFELDDIGGNGIRIEGRIDQIVITNPNIKNCDGNGIVVPEDSDTTISGFKGRNIRGDAVLVRQNAKIIHSLGLPDDIDIRKLNELLEQLKNTPHQKREQVIKESFLSGMNNLTGIINNFLQIIPKLPDF